MHVLMPSLITSIHSAGINEFQIIIIVTIIIRPTEKLLINFLFVIRNPLPTIFICTAKGNDDKSVL